MPMSLQHAGRLIATAIAAIVAGCAGPIRELHSVGGNEFTLFPADGRAPPPITCDGDVDARYACFGKELEQRGARLDAGGAFALVAPDGEPRFMLRTDTQNEASPIREDTRFPAASVTKMFLGAAAVSLSQEGALDLRAPIVRYLPELAGGGVGDATLHQLLTHTSGLGSPPLCEPDQRDLGDVLKKHGARRLLAPPGAVFNYSNLGYTFVALVFERVTGKPFEAVVHERVLVPAGIAGASFGPDRVVVRGRPPQSLASVPPRCRAMWPSGGLVLSIRELARWVHVLADAEASPLGASLLEQLTAPHVEVGARPGAAYGYGVGRVEQSGVTIFSHAGRLDDFSSFVAWAPGRRTGVAAFSNRGDPIVIAAGFRAMSTFLSLSENWRPAAMTARPLAAYVGVYVDEAGTLGRLRVSLEGERLAIDYLDGTPPLLPANFRFVFERGAEKARYVVTEVGVGERRDSSANDPRGDPATIRR